MIKMICDFCQHDVDKLTHIKIPVVSKPAAYNAKGIKLIEWEEGPIVSKEKDICDTCAKRLMKAISIMELMSDE